MRICSAKGCTAHLPEDRKDKCCKSCRAAYSAKWREKNLERSREISRDSKRRAKEQRARKKAEDPAHFVDTARVWRKRNPERSRAHNRNSYARHRDARRQKAKERRELDGDAIRASDRARYERDRYKRILQSEKIRARRAGATGTHTVAEWKSVLRHYHRKCVYCGVRLTNKTISKDHRIPLSRGGGNDIRNIVPACRRCNSKKHARTHEEYVALLTSVGCQPPTHVATSP